VVGEINFACRRCDLCRRGLSRHCRARRVMGILDADGAFAEYVALPAVNLHAVPDGVADETAVFTEPLAAAFQIPAQVRIETGTSAVVLGDGKLGLLIAQVLARAGARVLAVGKHDDALAILRRRGIDVVHLERWDRTPADLVVDATGGAAGFALAVGATRPRGTLVLKSTVAETAPLQLSPLVIDEITVVGSRCGPFEPALRALSAGDIDVHSLTAARDRGRQEHRRRDRAAQPRAAGDRRDHGRRVALWAVRAGPAGAGGGRRRRARADRRATSVARRGRSAPPRRPTGRAQGAARDAVMSVAFSPLGRGRWPSADRSDARPASSAAAASSAPMVKNLLCRARGV